MVPMPLCIIWLTVYYTRTESATGLVNIYIYIPSILYSFAWKKILQMLALNLGPLAQKAGALPMIIIISFSSNKA